MKSPFLAMALPAPLEALADIFFPARCLVCYKTGSWLHGECRLKLPLLPEPLCQICGKPLANSKICQSTVCQRPSLWVDKIRSVAYHRDSARQGVLKLKYKGVSSLANILAQEMATVVSRSGLGKAEAIVAVPLHTNHLRTRGYNQAGLLAAGLSRQLGLKLWENSLVRDRQTRSQVGLGLTARQDNVQNAFAWKGSSLAGLTILLVDDVCTTGATLNDCARALKEAGAARVWAVTFTREDHSQA